MEELNKAWAQLTMHMVEAHMNSVEALLGCKNLKDVVELQADFAKAQMEKAVSEGSKFSELTIKVANETIQPIQARVSEAVKQALKAA
jgi:phasin family protein